MSNPGMEHWSVVKWMLRYLRGTTTKALCFTGSSSALSEFFDSDLVGDIDTRMSTTWYVFTIGGTAVSWISRLQKVNALLTTKVVYVVSIWGLPS